MMLLSDALPREDIRAIAIRYRIPHELYLRQLSALGAWWCLGSSALEPSLLTRYAPAGLSRG
jgi:hypothetical protein